MEFPTPPVRVKPWEELIREGEGEGEPLGEAERWKPAFLGRSALGGRRMLAPAGVVEVLPGAFSA